MELSVNEPLGPAQESIKTPTGAGTFAVLLLDPVRHPWLDRAI